MGGRPGRRSKITSWRRTRVESHCHDVALTDFYVRTGKGLRRTFDVDSTGETLLSGSLAAGVKVTF